MRERAEAVLVEELPEWVWTGTHFIGTWVESGQRRAYTPNDFFKLFASMALVAKEYRTTSAEIIQFTRKADKAAS